MSLPGFSPWRDDADLHNQLNRFRAQVTSAIDQNTKAIAAIPPPGAASAAAAPNTGGVGASLPLSGSVVAGTGISTTSMPSGATEVNNSGVLALTGQGFVTTSGAVTSGLMAQRVTTGAILAGATTPVTLTWGTPFADANYTAVASVVDSTGNLIVVDIASFSATQVVVNVKNNDGSNPHTGVLCIIALHD